MRTPDRSQLLRDARLPAALAVASLVFAYPRPGAMAVVLGMCAPLAIRRAYPWIALATLTVAALVHVVTQELPTVATLAVPIMVHSLARWSGTAVARAGLVVALGGAVVGPARWMADRPEVPAATEWGTTVTAYAAVVVAAFIAGRRGRDREERERERQRLEFAEHERAVQAAAAEERTAVAREVHDIVAHSLAVIAVHAEGGRALSERHPERAPQVLDTIAGTAREALGDLREVVAMLRTGGSDAGYRPTPGIADIDELVSKLDGRARLRVDGDHRRVGPVAGTTLYRLVQESLTNVLRHAGPAAVVDVRLDIGERAIDLVVRDDGLGAAAADDGRGTGLAAMRERVQLHDGTLTAGPRAGGGFELHAVLPAHRATATAAS